VNTKELIGVLDSIAARIEQDKDFLTELDNVIGDGDHGINLARGFRAVTGKIEALAEDTPANVMKAVGMTLVATVGGASGPLYGTGFLKFAMAWNGKAEIGISDFLAGLKMAIDGISQRGRSQRGEKTMLDSMIPAAEALEAALAAGVGAAEALAAAVRSAEEGIEFTKTIIATKGRASYVGERSIGHQDPGATSFTAMLQEVTKAVG